MAFCDFACKYDPEKDTSEDLFKRILYSIYIRRLKNKKMVITFMGGDSGEGKSSAAVSIIDYLMEIQGADITPMFEVANIYTPLEYPEKINKILHNKEYKKLNVLAMHEARNVIKSTHWHTFQSQAVADVNAQVRQVKPLAMFIISQFIRDITKDVRYTLNYYMTVSRPTGKPARLKINVVWKDDRDLENPKIRRRKLQGYLIVNGRYRRYIPEYFELPRPRKHLDELFTTQDYDAKKQIIGRKLEDLLNEIKAEIGTESEKLKNMVDYYTEDPERLGTIGKRYRGKWKLKKSAISMHSLTKQEADRFESMLGDKLHKMKLAGDIDAE